jgi:hypothetical protein
MLYESFLHNKQQINDYEIMAELGFVLDAPLGGGVDTKSSRPWSMIACHVKLFIHSNFLQVGPLDLQASSVKWRETILAFYSHQRF